MPDKVRPIKPEEVAAEKKQTLPDAVLASFNALIVREWNGRSATVQQEDVVELMVNKDLKRHEIFENGWLEVEDIYRAAGWIVEYDKPGFNESYQPRFTFRPKRRR